MQRESFPAAPGALVIRADATATVGLGHVMRCLALASAWAASGGPVWFFGRIDSAPLRSRLKADGYCHVPVSGGWQETVAALTGYGLQGCPVVLDGYTFDGTWHQGLEEAGYPVVCIDDGARLPQYAVTAVLAPDPNAETLCYPALSRTAVMAGLHWRLLRPEFVSPQRPSRPADPGPSERGCLLVAFGGADRANLTTAVLQALVPVLGADDRVLVVLGAVNPHAGAVRQAAALLPCAVEILTDVQDMASLYARTAVAVSAAGGAAWEMAVCGVPAILVPVAENQRPGVQALTEAGAAVGVEPDDPDGLRQALSALRADPLRLARMAAAGPRVCDGLGAERACRVVRTLLDSRKLPPEQAMPGLILRPAVQADAVALHQLANDRGVRDNAFSPDPIPFDRHRVWYSARLASPDCCFLVADFQGLVVGVVRYDRHEETAEIDFAVHPAFRGRGLGVWLLRNSFSLACRTLRVAEARGTVFADNTASAASFLKAGFHSLGVRPIRGRPCEIFQKRDGGAAGA